MKIGITCTAVVLLMAGLIGCHSALGERGRTTMAASEEPSEEPSDCDREEYAYFMLSENTSYPFDRSVVLRGDRLFAQRGPSPHTSGPVTRWVACGYDRVVASLVDELVETPASEPPFPLDFRFVSVVQLVPEVDHDDAVWFEGETLTDEVQHKFDRIFDRIVEAGHEVEDAPDWVTEHPSPAGAVLAVDQREE